MSERRRRWGASAAALLLAGCAPGPNFVRPEAPTTTDYDKPESTVAAANSTSPGAVSTGDTTSSTRTAPSSTDHAANSASRAATSTDQAATDGVPTKGPRPPVHVPLEPGADIPAEWWQAFKSDALEQTLRLAMKDSPTMTSARATLAAAREAVVVARAGYLPRLAATTGGQRTGSGNGGFGGGSDSSTEYSLGLSASYSFNAFGGTTRRQVEQEQALADEQRYELAATYLTLTGSVVTQALSIASTRLQIEITLDLLASDAKNLELTQRMFELGSAARTDVLTAESQLAADETALPALRQQLSVAEHALTVLTGRKPADWSPPSFELSDFTLPPALPLSLPSTLVRQRPDILAAEEQLHAASAGVGIAVAQEYPSITLSASLTRDALTAADLFHDFDRLWNLGGTLTQPLFQGGALRAQVRGARDTFNAQAASYSQVVLTAFGQVADDLRALEHDEERVVAYRHSLRIAGDSLALQRISYAAGKTTVLQLIDAERTYSQARLGNASAEAQQLTDSADLFVALGGGWWRTELTPPP